MIKRFLLLLCILPIVGIVLWTVAGKNVSNLAILGLFLACPLGHLFFMSHHHLEQNKRKGVKHHEV